MNKNSVNVLLGFLAGATSGVIAGILFSPKSGEETRQSLAEKASKTKDDFNASLKKGVEKLGSFKDSVFSLVTKQEEEITQESEQPQP